MDRRPVDSLGASADGWLWKTCQQAWGLHKAWLFAKTPALRRAVQEITPDECTDLIRQAYKRRNGDG